MPLLDLPLSELLDYRSAVTEPSDLVAFWDEALRTARTRRAEPVLTPHQPGTYGALAAFDVTFSGADGDPIRAWYLRPRVGRRHAAAPAASRSSATAAAATCRRRTRSTRPRDTPHS